MRHPFFSVLCGSHRMQALDAAKVEALHNLRSAVVENERLNAERAAADKLLKSRDAEILQLQEELKEEREKAENSR